MKFDIRAEAARYYDSNPTILDDVPFYQKLVPSPNASVLELGCGTGRVTLPLIPYCGFIQGVDISPAMLSICREKLATAGIPETKAQVIEGDIADFELGQTFDLIIAPFRVLQNLERDQQVAGLFTCIRKHLASQGTCVLNVFRPFLEPDELRKQWARAEEKLSWQVPVQGGRLACYDRRARMDAGRLILYPELIYRRYEGETLVEESLLKIVMRCYYPDTFEKLIIDHGYAILNRWGRLSGRSLWSGAGACDPVP